MYGTKYLSNMFRNMVDQRLYTGMEPALAAALIGTAGSIATSAMNKPDKAPGTMTKQADTGVLPDSGKVKQFDEGSEDSKRQTLSKSRLGTKQLQIKLDTAGSGVNTSTASNSGLGIKV